MKQNNPPTICLFFQAHQPLRIREYDFFKIGNEPDYFDHEKNLEILNRVCERSYLPAMDLFEELHEITEGKFSFALGLSGSLLTQLEQHRPDVLARFQALVSNEIAFLTGGTFSHSLATFSSAQELSRQIQLQRKILWRLFRKRPRTFANTELIYRDDMVPMIESLGYTRILAEGVPRYLGHRSADYLYHSKLSSDVKLLLRNGGLSDDLGFRFSDSSWSEHPLTANKFLGWLQQHPSPLRNLFLDLETIGEHQGAETGIFDFWRAFVTEGVANGLQFENPARIVKCHESVDAYSSPKHSSWADHEKDKSAWQANVMQQEASQKLFRLQQVIKSSDSTELLESWTHLQSADHFIHMSTKGGEVGEVHQRDNPHGDAYDAYSYFMNILADLQVRSRISMAKHVLAEAGEMAI